MRIVGLIIGVITLIVGFGLLGRQVVLWLFGPNDVNGDG